MPDWLIALAISLPTASYGIVIGLLVSLERKVARVEAKLDAHLEALCPRKAENS